MFQCSPAGELKESRGIATLLRSDKQEPEPEPQEISADVFAKLIHNQFLAPINGVLKTDRYK